MACVRILIADDHELVRQGLRTLLALRPAWEVCGEAADGVEAIEKAAQLRPDVVLLDVSMPRLSGLEAVPAIRRESPTSEIVIVSQHDPAEILPSALRAGVRRFVSKADIGSALCWYVAGLSKRSGISADRLREIQTQGSGVGIAGMRERVLHFNGDMSITSLRNGTRIAVSFPVAPGNGGPEPLVLNS